MSNTISWISNQFHRLLGISTSPANDLPPNLNNPQQVEIINSGSLQVPFPPKPDGWLADESWARFQELRFKYPQNFQDANQYINSFTPAEVEMIMAWVGEEHCFINMAATETGKIIGDIHLFKRIAETRQILELAAENLGYFQLEYIKLDYALETMPAQKHYKYKFIGDDTIYKS
jgi:hypothetical protein